MGYLENNLLPGETVAYRAHLHPVIYLQPALFALVGLAFVVLSFAVDGLKQFWMLGVLFLLYAAIGLGLATRVFRKELT